MMIKNNESGVALIATIIIAFILAVIGAGTIKLSYNHYKIVKQKSVDKERAYHFALGGIQKAVYEVQKSNIAYAIASIPNTNETWTEGNLTRGETQIIAYCDPDNNCDYGAYPEYTGKLKPGEYAIQSVATY